MTTYDVDLFVIGAGSGGVRAARVAASYGARVAIAEESRVGGTCVIRGCVPKKLLLYASRFADEFEDSVGFGWQIGEPRFDWPTLIANKDREIDRLNAAYIRTLDNAGVTIHQSRAVLEGPHKVRLLSTGQTITAGTILVAVGGWPVLDDTVSGAEFGITSNEILHLKELPKRLAVVGGGFVAVEFAGIMNGFGVDTTLYYRGEEILRGFDDDMRKGVRSALEARGVTIHCGTRVTALERGDGVILGQTDKGEAFKADQVLFAIGRAPNTRDLGLDTAGVALNPNGAVRVDAYSRTNVPNIYAIGDVTNRLQLTPVAIREGHAFADTVFGKKPIAVDHADVPQAVFSTPEIGTVGLTEAAAREAYPSIDIYRTDFKPMRGTLSGRSERMIMKLVVDAETDRVLGCHLLGPDAAEIIQVVAIAVKMRATKADFDATVALHPTVAEELVTMRQPTTRHRRAAAE